MKQKKKFVMPNVYLLITMLIFVAGFLTYIIPAGVYDFVESGGRSIVDPASFHYLEESTPVSIWEMVLSIPQGLKKACNIVFLVLLVGGGVGIVNETKALDALISGLALKMRSKLYICVPLTLFAFGIFGQLGILNPVLAFVPLGLMLAKSLGGDACVGVCLVTVAANIGFTCGAFSSPSTGTAQAIAGLPLYSGMAFRLFCWAVFVVVNSVYLIRYINKIRKDPTKSVCYGIDTAMANQEDVEIPELTGKRKLVCLTFLAGICVLVYASINAWDSATEIPMIFVLTGIACGLVYGFSPNRIATLFINGCKSTSSAATIVGFASGIGIVLTNGNIIYTIVHSLSNISSALPLVITTILMFLANLVINIFITSGSGQAAVVMPIFSPLAQLLGMTQQNAVLAFNFGDGLSNSVLPTSTATMGAIGIAGVPYDVWMKFYWKLFVIQVVTASGLLTIATIIGLGPF